MAGGGAFAKLLQVLNKGRKRVLPRSNPATERFCIDSYLKGDLILLTEKTPNGHPLI